MSVNKPRIMIFDIETSQSKAYVWGVGYNQTITYDQLIMEDGCYRKVICICWKYLGEKEVYSLSWDDNQDDTAMLEEFNQHAKEADLLLAHNGQNFDVKELRTHMAIRKTKEPWCETPCLDTLKDWRRVFRFPCGNRLDAVVRMMGLGHKNPMGRQDWIKAENGDPKALEKMVKYCKMDVRILEKVYKRFEPYVPKTILNSKLMRLTHEVRPGDPGNCPHCDSHRIVKNGTRMAQGTVIQRYMCRDCNKTS